MDLENDPLVKLLLSRRWTVQTTVETTDHHTVIPIDNVSCFCWASKCASKYAWILLQIDKYCWKTDLLVLNKILSLQVTHIESDGWWSNSSNC